MNPLIDMIIIRDCRKLILFALFQFFVTLIFAQEPARIKGKVLDFETGRPIPFANIFINNTSIGTSADTLGNFIFINVPIYHTDLAVSAIGYEAFSLKVKLSPDTTFDVIAKLHPSMQLLNEITIKASGDKKWKKNYELFVKEFLGTGPNASSCEIKNPQVLNFSFLDNGVFKAYASSPLEIYNQALGYKILVILNFFEFSAKGYSASYQSRFIEIEPENAKEEFRWQVNRLRSYKGSLRHFLKSVIDKREEEEGFRVYYRKLVSLKNGTRVIMHPDVSVSSEILFPKISSDHNFKNYYRLLGKGIFQIHYLNKFTPKSKRLYPDFPHPISWLEIPGEFLLCPFNGIINSNSNCSVSGDMSQYRVADILPEDYDPVPDEGSAYFFRQDELKTIEGIVKDSTSGQPLAGARIFINNSLFKTSADNYGRFDLKKIPQGIYDLVITYRNYPFHCQRVEVNDDSVTNVQITLKSPELSQNIEANDENMAVDMKLNYFTDHFLRWSPFSLRILNPSVLEIKPVGKKIKMWTRTSLELEDDQTGYKLHYYLKEAILDPQHRKNDVITGFTSFDTLTANTFRKRDRWQSNRNDFYHGSTNHFIKSLIEGRARDEGFEIYALSTGRQKYKATGKRDTRKKKFNSIIGDSLLMKEKAGTMFKLKLPRNTTIYFQGDRGTRIDSDSNLRISTAGILFSQKGLRMKGPMGKKDVPILPIEFAPSSEAITDPKVWIFIREKEMNSFNLMREKAFVHTDKGYYYPGEKIWYKVYMRYADPEIRDSLSKVLYVELINPDKKVIKHEILKIQNGTASGDFALPPTLDSGIYYLRAYTRWALNFQAEDIFLQPLPILSPEQNIKSDKNEIRHLSSDGLVVTIQPDRNNYKLREKIKIQVKVTDSAGEPVRSNLSISITDADKVSRSSWTKSIQEDSFHLKKENWKYKRISHQIEKAFGYDCIVKKERLENPASVMISTAKDGQIKLAIPDKDARFRFYVDFYDTASFIFRANLKNGSFAGHVLIDRSYSPEITLPSKPVKFFLQSEDVRMRIKYSYDQSEKATLLEEVIIQGTRIGDPLQNYDNGNSLLQNPGFAIEGAALNNIAQSIQNIDAFMGAIAAMVPGARYDEKEHKFYVRTSGISGEAMSTSAGIYVNNILYQDISTLSPVEISRVEIYRDLYELSILGTNAANGVVRLFLKKRLEDLNKPDRYDKYTLSGYASPSHFYMPDHANTLDSTLPDLRTTIYWDPNINTGTDESNVTFFAAEMPTRYRIIMEGLSDTGQPIYAEKIIEVK